MAADKDKDAGMTPTGIKQGRDGQNTSKFGMSKPCHMSITIPSSKPGIVVAYGLHAAVDVGIVMFLRISDVFSI